MPDWISAVRARLVQLGLTAVVESDLVDEIAQHLDDRFRELYSAGVTRDDAYRQTIAELDDVYPIRTSLERNQLMPRVEPVRSGEQSSGNFLEGFWKDFRYAVRTMRKNPVFVLVVILTLSLGIGANTTVFTLINTLMLNPLPVRNPGELVAISGTGARNAASASSIFPISYADLRDYQSRNEIFASLAAFTPVRGMTLLEHGASRGIFGELVTSNYFATLGLTPTRGRFLAPEEDGAPGAHPVAVLNYATWQTLFGGAEDIIGRQVLVNNIAITVIGVAPPHFIGVNGIFGPDLWAPTAMAERLFPNSMQNVLTDRAKAAFLGVGRLKPQTTEAQARANVETIASALSRFYAASNEDHNATVRPLREVLLAVNGNTAGGMLFAGAALSIVVGIVLLIACSNVANLLLARSAARQHEIAVRLAMGASRSRLIRQLLTESVLLAFLSGLAGLLLAWAGLHLLFGQLPGAANFPAPKLDAVVLAFALLVSLATGLLFGILPALKASRTHVAESLKEAGRSAGRSRRRVTMANALLVGQVAFSFLLLVTAALFLRSIGRAYGMDPGFQTTRLAVFPTNPGQAGYSQAQIKTFYQDVRDRVLTVPGVETVSWASNMPLWAKSISGIEVEGRMTRSRDDRVRAVLNTIDRNYFETAGIPMESGRAFTDVDQAASVPVAIVNEKMARDYWPAGALGRRLQLPGEKSMRQIVGIARTANYTAWGEPPQSCIYVPLRQNDSDSLVLYVRTRGDPRGMLVPVEREIRTAGPQVLLFGIRTGSEVIDGGLFQARIGVALLTIFGMLALALASIGLYGVLAYSVNQRKREIGLRIALGATRARVLRLVLKEGMSLVMSGVLIGFAVTLPAGRVLSRMLIGISAGDPVSFAGAALTLSVVALLACYLPARWATRVDPLETLRES